MHTGPKLRRTVHRTVYGIRMTLLKVLGPADLPESVDPSKQLKRDHEVQEAFDTAAEVAAEQRDKRKSHP